jgi:hypothetical protein
MHQLLPILEKALDRRVVLPKRRIENVEAFIKLFPEVKDLFIDGTYEFLGILTAFFRLIILQQVY